MYVPTLEVRGHTGFRADPVGVGVRVGIGVPLLVPTISLEPMGRISTNLHCNLIYHWDKLKS